MPDVIHRQWGPFCYSRAGVAFRLYLPPLEICGAGRARAVSIFGLVIARWEMHHA